ncbi:hypothetical protein CTI12_AA378980 [Artemisia annua]|uniref:Uncharacterized protein n=1 Tax=Artemisia annua TaxID=35608 RepID=A0A2U1MGU0_ARTAN|nr:hypothetical protein CTI12_AA378980 [Artemisia annua]
MEEACYDQSPPTQDSYHEDEVIDTLSLSDLMIYDNNGDPHDFYQLDEQNLNFDDDEEFEFSSEFLKTSMSNNVIFCGKLIPYKESIVSPSNHKLESKKQHKKRWWISRFFKKSSRSKSNNDSEKLDLRYEQVPIRRVSILASATKPRWYFLLFGFGSNSFPAHMHIRDLKKRQTSAGNKDCIFEDFMNLTLCLDCKSLNDGRKVVGRVKMRVKRWLEWFENGFKSGP